MGRRDDRQVIQFEELVNTSIEMIGSKIQSKYGRDPSPSVPKLDFKGVKELQEQDWMAYAKRLEESIKVLNERIHILEDDNDRLTQKHHKQAASNAKLYELNERLNQAVKALKDKAKAQKEKLREKLQKARQCSFCNNLVEMSMSNFTMTYDKVNVSFDAATINNSFAKGSFAKGSQHHRSQSHQAPSSTTKELQDFVNDYSGSNKINDDEQRGEFEGGRPKILKDSSKYVKRKSSTGVRQPSGVTQSVQEGLT